MSKKPAPKIDKNGHQNVKGRYHWDLGWIVFGRVTRTRGLDNRDEEGKIIEK